MRKGVIKYTKQDIINIFKHSDIGDVEHVQFGKTNMSPQYNSVIVYMKCFYITEIGKQIYSDILIHDETYVFYPEVRNRSISWILMSEKNVPSKNIGKAMKNKELLERNLD